MESQRSEVKIGPQIEIKGSDATLVARAYIGASLTICPEQTVVNRASNVKLTAIENEVVAEIRALRTSAGSGPLSALLESPARLTHHFVLASHGNMQFRFSTLAQELGVEIRTLERAFVAEYEKTMMQFQIEVRLTFSRHLLSIFPPTKISAIAALLGYELVQDFNRFFKKHMN
jgi:transcriptional regulator GlxA family with amidase domain